MYMFGKHVHVGNGLIYKMLRGRLCHYVHVCAKFYKKNRTCNIDMAKGGGEICTEHNALPL